MTTENLLNFISDFEAEYGRPPSCLRISEEGFTELANSVDGGHYQWSASLRSVGNRAIKKMKLFGVEVYTYTNNEELCEA